MTAYEKSCQDSLIAQRDELQQKLEQERAARVAAEERAEAAQEKSDGWREEARKLEQLVNALRCELATEKAAHSLLQSIHMVKVQELVASGQFIIELGYTGPLTAEAAREWLVGKEKAARERAEKPLTVRCKQCGGTCIFKRASAEIVVIHSCWTKQQREMLESAEKRIEALRAGLRSIEQRTDSGHIRDWVDAALAADDAAKEKES